MCVYVYIYIWYPLSYVLFGWAQQPTFAKPRLVYKLSAVLAICPKSVPAVSPGARGRRSPRRPAARVLTQQFQKGTSESQHSKFRCSGAFLTSWWLSPPPPRKRLQPQAAGGVRVPARGVAALPLDDRVELRSTSMRCGGSLRHHHHHSHNPHPLHQQQLISTLITTTVSDDQLHRH